MEGRRLRCFFRSHGGLDRVQKILCKVFVDSRLRADPHSYTNSLQNKNERSIVYNSEKS